VWFIQWTALCAGENDPPAGAAGPGGYTYHFFVPASSSVTPWRCVWNADADSASETVAALVRVSTGEPRKKRKCARLRS
jgi:hypothetical protein